MSTARGEAKAMRREGEINKRKLRDGTRNHLTALTASGVADAKKEEQQILKSQILCFHCCYDRKKLDGILPKK